MRSFLISFLCMVPGLLLVLIQEVIERRRHARWLAEHDARVQQEDQRHRAALRAIRDGLLPLLLLVAGGLVVGCGDITDAGAGDGAAAGLDAGAELRQHDMTPGPDAGADACGMPRLDCTGTQGACPAGAQLAREDDCGLSVYRPVCCPANACTWGCPACIGCP